MRTSSSTTLSYLLKHFPTPRPGLPRPTLRSMSHPSGPPRLSRALPKGTWDSHMHIVDTSNYPLSPNAAYTPPSHTLPDAKSFYGPLGIQNLVIVQPSIYGNDNSCTLSALKALTPAHGRAVIQFDPSSTTHDQLAEHHALGVRGVRINLVSINRTLSPSELHDEVSSYAKLIKPLGGWVLQLYAPLSMVTDLEPIVPDLGVKVCLDHFASPTLAKSFDENKAVNPYELPGFEALVKLLKQGRTYVKLSGQYRISKDESGRMRDLDPIGRELLKQAPDRCVWASDWPHTRFENIDSVPFVEKCYEWCGNDEEKIDKLFRRNAEELWDVKS